MKIIHLSSGVSYCSAVYRISESLGSKGVDSKILCNFTDLNTPMVQALPKSTWWNCKRKLLSFITKLITKKIYGMGKDGPVSFGILTNKELFKNEAIKNADVIHLHWINDGLLSIRGILELSKYDKPIVITTHDMWFVTGGCHVTKGCERFCENCGNCIVLKSKHCFDISRLIYSKKKKLWNNLNFFITTPSSFTFNKVKKSALCKNCSIQVIPNTLDTNKYRRIDIERNSKFTILFGAENVFVPHKGFEYLVKALELLRETYTGQLRLLIFGRVAQQLEINGYEIEYLGYINSEEKMSIAYSSADVYVTPSLEDSFNQTVAESMSCETPVVAFDGTGIVDIIDHRENGYLAKSRDSADLANGIKWVIEQDRKKLGQRARKKITEKFDYKVVSSQFIELYKNVLKE